MLSRSTLALAGALVILAPASLFVGVLDVDMASVLSGDPSALWILVVSRLPRLLAILCTGAGMGVAGLIMQQLCMNRFVSPTTGATISSAQLGVLASLVLLPGAGLWGRAGLAFLAAIIGTWIFVLILQSIRHRDTAIVPLVGIMFSNIVSGVTSFIAFQFELNQAIATWITGHFSMVVRGNYELVWLALPLIVIAYVFAGYFNVVGMGKDLAEGLGVNHDVVLFAGLTIAALITAAVVCVVGSIPYVGLVVPNVVTMFKGDRIRGTLPDTALFGGLFVLICDVVCRVVIYPYELPIGLVVGIVGSVVFIGLLLWRLAHGRRAPKARGGAPTTCCEGGRA